MLLNMAEDLKEYAKIKVSPGVSTGADSKATDKDDKKDKKPKSVESIKEMAEK
jgi:hypothetical protein